jgi:hypothetical protein
MPDEDLMQAEWEKHGKIINLFILSNILKKILFQVHVIIIQQQNILQR